ncbi:unnamed protein product [Prorocentrum cordatum]|uniref:AdoMet activation domain-containing protein n=1 Tax=Prorocentrum cordatum TaxID=2364126 RepID=A0ABN9T9U7_9DINO|nr:unnamed protein product [Polarella glacialis]
MAPSRGAVPGRSRGRGSHPLGAAAPWAVGSACRGAWAVVPALASPPPAAECHSARAPGADGPAGPLGCLTATGPQAEKLPAEAEEMFERIVTGVADDWPANPVSDNIEAHADDERFTEACQPYGLRQLLDMGASTFCRRGDVIAHKGECLDHIAASANTFGLGRHLLRNISEAKGGIDKAFLVDAFADSLAESLAEPIHREIRTTPWVASEPGGPPLLCFGTLAPSKGARELALLVARACGPPHPASLDPPACPATPRCSPAASPSLSENSNRTWVDVVMTRHPRSFYLQRISSPSTSPPSATPSSESSGRNPADDGVSADIQSSLAFVASSLRSPPLFSNLVHVLCCAPLCSAFVRCLADRYFCPLVKPFG